MKISWTGGKYARRCHSGGLLPRGRRSVAFSCPPSLLSAPSGAEHFQIVLSFCDPGVCFYAWQTAPCWDSGRTPFRKARGVWLRKGEAAADRQTLSSGRSGLDLGQDPENGVFRTAHPQAPAPAPPKSSCSPRVYALHLEELCFNRQWGGALMNE